MNRSTTLAVLALAACNAPVELSEGADPDRLVETPATTLQQEVRGDRGGIIVGNALTTERLVRNTLLVSPSANDALTRNPLKASSFTGASAVPALRDALVDPWSREVLGYIVGCALPAGASFTVGSIKYSGLAGLCPAWGSSSPGVRIDSTCQQLVSACMLSRNNERGWHVPLSVRGDDRLNPNLAAGSQFDGFDWRDAFTPVASLQTACSPTAPQAGARRNCGWSANRVFTCNPGTPVTIAAGAPASDACTSSPLGAVTSGDMVLRLCEGLAGCDDASALDWSEGYECPSYLYKPTLTALCPPSGVVNVMAAPYYSLNSGSVDLGALSAGFADEKGQFPVREGAFYGTLFDASALPYTVTYNPQTGVRSRLPASGPAVVFPKMYACADPGWVDGVRYLTEVAAREGRVCSLGDCAANPVGLCTDVAAGPCQQDFAGDREFRSCKAGGVEWKYGLTTFLPGACDLTKNPVVCQRQ